MGKLSWKFTNSQYFGSLCNQALLFSTLCCVAFSFSCLLYLEADIQLLGTSEAKDMDSTSMLLLLSHVSRVRLCATPQTAATRLPCPWDSPGKNTGVGCHWNAWKWKVKVKLVAQSCPTLSDPMDCSLPGSSAPGIFQARVLEWGAIAFSMDLLTPYSFWSGRLAF